MYPLLSGFNLTFCRVEMFAEVFINLGSQPDMWTLTTRVLNDDHDSLGMLVNDACTSGRG